MENKVGLKFPDGRRQGILIPNIGDAMIEFVREIKE